MATVQKLNFFLKSVMDTISMSKSQAQALRCSLPLTLILIGDGLVFMLPFKKLPLFLKTKSPSLAANTIHAMKTKVNVTQISSVQAP